MLALYGCSMTSGFPCTRDIPKHCLESWSVVSDEPIVTIPQVLRNRLGEDNVQICALPGIGSAEVRKWFEAVPQWWGEPSIFWPGRNDRPSQCKDTAANFIAMAQQATGPWWMMPSTLVDSDLDAYSMFDRVNDELREFAGDRFIDPVMSLFGTRVIPREWRLDKIHPSSRCNELFADWLIANTIGAQAQTQAA